MSRRPNPLHRRALGAAALAAAALLTLAADWPQYRGPRRDGVSAETGLLGTWPEGGPKVLWRVPLGEGFSGLTVAGNRLFTLQQPGDATLVTAHDAGTGKELWRFRLDAAYEDSQGNGPRSTPTVDGNRVYALSARGKLAALDAGTGKAIWRKDLVQEFGATIPQWGVSTQPAVDGNLLLVDVGGRPGNAVVAFDKASGKVVWKSESDIAGYSQPVALTVDGVAQLVFFRGNALVALSPRDGKTLWKLPWRTDWDVNAATPIFVPPNQLFVSSGYDTGSALLRLRADGGRPRVEEVWKSKVMKNQFSSSVVRGGHVYGFDNKVLECIDLATGKVRWKQSGLGHGSLLLAQGQLYVLSERGRLVLVDATPDAYKERGSVQILQGKCWTPPTLANGRLYVRNEKEMVCLNVEA